jgi:hypothetical protein
MKENDFITNVNREMNVTGRLIAPCGINCTVCRAYLRERNPCPGCRSFDKSTPVTRAQCKIKNCATFRKGDSKYCFQCGTYPCERLIQLDKRYRSRYQMSVIENLENIKGSGIRKFISHEKVRWTCHKCGGTFCVHRGCCSSCGETRRRLDSKRI